MQSKTINNLYPKETAGRLMQQAIPVFRTTDTIKTILTSIESKTSDYSTIDYIYIVDSQHRLKKILSIGELLTLTENDNIDSIATQEKDIISVHPYTDQEKVATKAIRNKIKAVPVVDTKKKLLGIVSSDTIRDIVNNEVTEDILKSVGAGSKILEPTDLNLGQNIRARLPWLLIGLLGGIIAVYVIKIFETSLESELILLAFIPLITYMADAVGTQTQMVFIRTLALDDKLKKFSYFVQEMKLAMSLSITLTVTTFIILNFILDSTTIALIVSISLLLTVNISSFIGILFPSCFYILKQDPATASGPFATIIRDIISLIIFLIIGTILI